MRNRSTSSSVMSSSRAGRPRRATRSPRSSGRICSARGHQHRALDGVLELADIARPGVVEQRLQRRRVEAGDRLAVALRRAGAGSARPAAGCPRGGRAAAAAGSRSCSAGRADPARKRPAATRRARSALVAERTRTSARAGPRRPDALELAGLEHPQQLRLQAERACWRSRRGTACRRRPARSGRRGRSCASVKAPFTWPNSSLSNTPSDRPPALTVTSGLPARARTPRAAPARPCSLPVPFSPVISTLASDGPTRSISSSTGRIAARLGDQRRPARPRLRSASVLRLEPPARGAARGPARPGCGGSAAAARCPTASATKSRAPRRIASTATSTLPQAVITTTGSVGSSGVQLRAGRGLRGPRWCRARS